MIRLSKLYQSINDYYQQALYAYASLKYGAESYVMPDDPEEDSGVIPTTSAGIAQAGENLSYDIDNEGLLTQFDSLLDTYKAFLRALEIKPEDFDKGAEESAEESADDISGLIDTLNTRWQRLVNSPYLKLPPDDERYTESFPAQKVLDLAQAMVKDASGKLEQQAKQVGYTPEELIQAQKAAETFNDPQFNKQETGMTASGDRIKQQMDANRRQRDKLNFIKKVGPKHPEWAKVEKLLFDSRRYYAEAMADEKRRPEIQAKAYDRKLKQRAKDDVMFKLVERYEKSINPSDKSRIAHELIENEKAVLSKRFNLDDPFVLNSPEVQDKLSIEKIIESVKNKNKKWRERAKTKIIDLKKEGDLPGLIIKYRQQLATTKNEALQAVKRRLQKDPALVPYKQAIEQARKSGDASALQKAQTDESDFLNKRAYENEIVQKIITELPSLYEFRNKCEELVKSGTLGPGNLNEETRAQVQRLIQEGKSLTQIYREVYRTPMQTVEKMIATLNSRI